MKETTPKVMLKLSAAILLLAILTPSFVKLAHAFENHKHEVCTNPTTTHFHEFDLDCEFYKFKLQTQTFSEFANIDIVETSEINTVSASQYKFFTSTTFSSCFLRGPPQLV